MAGKLIRRWQVLLLMIVCLGIGLAVNGGKVNSATPPEPAAQDVMSLDRRLTSLEQRLYPMESSLRRLEQQSTTYRPTPTQPTRDPELDRLRSEVEILKARIRELECGLVHLDERTLSASMKEARRRATAQGQDPCRANAETPIQPSIR